MPLGKISSKQIRQGFAILNELNYVSLSFLNAFDLIITHHYFVFSLSY